MKIIQLKAENIKRVKAVDIRPDGAVIHLLLEGGATLRGLTRNFFELSRQFRLKLVCQVRRCRDVVRCVLAVRFAPLDIRVVGRCGFHFRQQRVDVDGVGRQIARHRNAISLRPKRLKVAGELQAKIDAAGELPAPIDVASLRQRFERGRTINAGIDKRALKAKHIAEAANLEKKSQYLTDAMEAREKLKADAITSAKMPIDDITFGDELVLYKGLPFSQASSAEQLRVSVAIAMAANPKLKVLRIKDGGLLDEDGMRMLSEMAETADYQVWIETVHANGPVAVEMLDGAIVGAPEPAAEEDAAAEAPARAKKPAVIETVAGPSSGGE